MPCSYGCSARSQSIRTVMSPEPGADYKRFGAGLIVFAVEGRVVTNEKGLAVERRDSLHNRSRERWFSAKRTQPATDDIYSM